MKLQIGSVLHTNHSICTYLCARFYPFHDYHSSWSARTPTWAQWLGRIIFYAIVIIWIWLISMRALNCPYFMISRTDNIIYWSYWQTQSHCKHTILTWSYVWIDVCWMKERQRPGNTYWFEYGDGYVDLNWQSAYNKSRQLILSVKKCIC